MAIKQDLLVDEKLILIRVLNNRIKSHMTENCPIHKKSFLKKHILTPISIIEKISIGNNKLTKWEQILLNGCIIDSINFAVSEGEKSLLTDCTKKMDFYQNGLLVTKLNN